MYILCNHRSLESDQTQGQTNTLIVGNKDGKPGTEAVIMKLAPHEVSGAHIRRSMPTFCGADLTIISISQLEVTENLGL